MIRYRLFFVVTSVLLLMSSCDLLDCSQGVVSHLRIKIYDGAGNAITLPDTLTITTCGTDSVLVNRDTNVREIVLPLSYHAPVDTFVLKYSSDYYEVNETLYVSKTNDIYFESPDCPTVMMHKLLSVTCTSNFTDSVIIENDKVNFEEATHLKLFVQN